MKPSTREEREQAGRSIPEQSPVTLGKSRPTHLAPFAPARHPGFHVPLPRSTSSKLLGRHLEHPDRVSWSLRDYNQMSDPSTADAGKVLRGTHLTLSPNPSAISFCADPISSIISLLCDEVTAKSSTFLN